jgi:hypothetical protein
MLIIKDLLIYLQPSDFEVGLLLGTFTLTK